MLALPRGSTWRRGARQFDHEDALGRSQSGDKWGERGKQPAVGVCLPALGGHGFKPPPKAPLTLGFGDLVSLGKYWSARRRGAEICPCPCDWIGVTVCGRETAEGSWAAPSTEHPAPLGLAWAASPRPCVGSPRCSHRPNPTGSNGPRCTDTVGPCASPRMIWNPPAQAFGLPTLSALLIYSVFMSHGGHRRPDIYWIHKLSFNSPFFTWLICSNRSGFGPGASWGCSLGLPCVCRCVHEASPSLPPSSLLVLSGTHPCILELQDAPGSQSLDPVLELAILPKNPGFNTGEPR